MSLPNEEPVTLDSPCEGFPDDCPNLISVAAFGGDGGGSMCGCGRIEQAEKGMTGVHAALAAVGQSLEVTRAAFHELALLVLGEEDSTVHTCPPEGSGIMPCCQRTPFDVPATDRLTEDPSQVTCLGVPHG